MKMPGYNYQTGNPRYDNQSRRMNKALRRQMRHFRITTPRGRRRKKYLQRVEGANFLTLVHELAMDHYRKDRANG